MNGKGNLYRTAEKARAAFIAARMRLPGSRPIAQAPPMAGLFIFWRACSAHTRLCKALLT